MPSAAEAAAAVDPRSVVEERHLREERLATTPEEVLNMLQRDLLQVLRPYQNKDMESMEGLDLKAKTDFPLFGLIFAPALQFAHQSD